MTRHPLLRQDLRSKPTLRRVAQSVGRASAAGRRATAVLGEAVRAYRSGLAGRAAAHDAAKRLRASHPGETVALAPRAKK